jgi:hypothetical protein
LPAVDPERLRNQIGRVVAVFDDPPRFRFRCLELLEFYESRVRPTAFGSASVGIRALGVPTAVLRDLEAELRSAAEADTYAGAMNAETLWTAPVVEARLLAIAIVETQPASGISDWVGAWADTAEDPLLIDRLARGPLRSLHAADGLGYWSALRGYLESRSAPRVTLAMDSIGELAAELPDDELAEVFAALGAARLPGTGESWRALVEMMRRLAARTPAETAQHLIDAMAAARPNAARLARQTLDAFPGRQRQALRRELRLASAG